MPIKTKSSARNKKKCSQFGFTINSYVFTRSLDLLELVPDGGMDDLVEQVVMQVCGCRQTKELHSERRDEA